MNIKKHIKSSNFLTVLVIVLSGYLLLNTEKIFNQMVDFGMHNKVVSGNHHELLNACIENKVDKLNTNDPAVANIKETYAKAILDGEITLYESRVLEELCGWCEFKNRIRMH